MRDEDKQRRRREWEIEQRLNKKHEEKKLWMIKKYEEERFHKLRCDRRESLQRSDSSDEQRTIRMEIEDERLENPIDKKELLHRTKVEIQQDALNNRKNRDNENPDAIILPRRDGEGHRPIFDREEIKSASTHTNIVGESQAATMSHNRIKSEDRLPVREGLSPPRRNPTDSRASHCHRTQRSSGHHDDAMRNDKYRNYRGRSKERRVYVEEERNKSTPERPPSFTRNESSYRRSRNSPPNGKYTKERYASDDRNRSSFRRDYSNRFREPNNRVSLNNVQGNVGLNSGHNYGIGHSEYNSAYNSEYNSENNIDYNSGNRNAGNSNSGNRTNTGNSNSGNQTSSSTASFNAPVHTDQQYNIKNMINHFHITEAPKSNTWEGPSFPLIRPFITAGPPPRSNFFPAAGFRPSFTPGPPSTPDFFVAPGDLHPALAASAVILVPSTFPMAEPLALMEPVYLQPGRRPARRPPPPNGH